mmetsp:Transcript_18270/g.22689  ORF Transcript_18270/g.22689 Transcript_18270/m.22689 type:complete len:201 (+) Transcript_18270:346-948(+)
MSFLPLQRSKHHLRDKTLHLSHHPLKVKEAHQPNFHSLSCVSQTHHTFPHHHPTNLSTNSTLHVFETTPRHHHHHPHHRDEPVAPPPNTLVSQHPTVAGAANEDDDERTLLLRLRHPTPHPNLKYGKPHATRHSRTVSRTAPRPFVPPARRNRRRYSHPRRRHYPPYLPRPPKIINNATRGCFRSMPPYGKAFGRVHWFF